MFATPRFYHLSDGQHLAVDEYGDPSGLPVFYFHGWPSSRLQAGGADAAARGLGLRLISPDRPGIGLSSFQKNRQLLDWPPLLAELADQIGVGTFRVLAVSGGAPYALATAWALPDRVAAVAVVSGAPPLPEDLTEPALHGVYRALLRFYRKRPGAMRAAFRLARPFLTIRPPRWAWPWLVRMTSPSDAWALCQPDVFEGSFACYREAWRGSALGVATDAEVYARAWGFAPAEVRAPVRVWHGRDDNNFSWKLAAALARELPRGDFRLLENEGHYSLPIRHYREILEDLKQMPAVPGPAQPLPAAR